WDAKGGGQRHSNAGGRSDPGADCNFQPQSPERFDLFVDGDLNTQQGIGALMPQRDLLRRAGLGTNVDRSGNQFAARGLQDQLGTSPAGPIGDPDVGAALEPVAGLGAQAKLP